MKRLKTYFDRGDADNGSRKEYHLWGMGGVGKTQIALKFSEESERNSGYAIIHLCVMGSYNQTYKPQPKDFLDRCHGLGDDKAELFTNCSKAAAGRPTGS